MTNPKFLGLIDGIMLLPASIIFGWLWQTAKPANCFRIFLCLCFMSRAAASCLGVAIESTKQS
jgi:hypothetical protein